MKQEITISTFQTSRLTNALFTRLHTRVYEAINSFSQAATLLDLDTQDLSDWGSLIVVLTDISKQAQGSVKTATLVSADKKRDDIVSYLFQRVNSARKSPFDAEKEAGTLLYNLTKNYKGIANESYDEETQHIDGLLYDLNKSNYARAVQTLSLTNTIASLDLANTEFKDIQKSRADERVETASVGKSKEYRAEATKYYEYALRSIESVYRLADALSISQANKDRIKNLADTINQIIAEVKTTATATSTKKKDETATE